MLNNILFDKVANSNIRLSVYAHS